MSKNQRGIAKFGATVRLRLLLTALALCLLESDVCRSAYCAAITTFDPPGSFATVPVSINPAGVIAGYYGAGFADHGFLRTPDGAITTFDVPGAASTVLLCVNPAGVIAGDYLASGVDHGF